MRLIFRAALRAKKNFRLLAFSMVSLLMLTIANQLEMFSLGPLMNNGADFFSLFGKERVVDGTKQSTITLEDIQEKWGEIDKDGEGVVTTASTRKYIATRKEPNPIQWAQGKIKQHLDISTNLRALTIVLICVAVFKAFWLFTSRYVTQVLAVRFSQDLRQQYFAHIQKLPMKFYQQYNIGSLSARVAGDASQIASSINSCMTNFCQTPFIVITTFSICLFLSWKLSMIVIIGFPSIVLPIVWLAKRVKRVSRKKQQNQEGFTSMLIDFLAGIQTVKMFGMEEFAMKKYQQQNEQMGMLEAKTAKYAMLARPVLHAIITVCFSVVIVLGLNVVHMSLPQLIVFCALLHSMYEPIKKFADENGNIQQGIVAAERMFEVLNIQPDIQDEPDAVSLSSFDDCIEFDHVWFKYDEQWVLKDVSFKVKKGETVAIVGPTGAGKSTIVQLLPRLYDVQKGEIRIDGKPLAKLTQESIRKQISFVAQRPFLFIDTIEANISYGRDLPHDKLVDAAKRAYADEFINELPLGYRTLIGERGINFSGGQQQRLAIARAIAKDSPILVLDEATSALDSLSEQKIKAAISGLHGSMTQIIIAHRLGTIEHADRIIYIEKGEKLAEGTMAELLKTCEPFKRAWDANFHASKPELVST